MESEHRLGQDMSAGHIFQVLAIFFYIPMCYLFKIKRETYISYFPMLNHNRINFCSLKLI